MRLVRRRLPSFQDAEDCVQETMARAAAHAALDRNRLGAFLTSVALRLCIDFYRDMDRRRRLMVRAALNMAIAACNYRSGLPDESLAALLRGMLRTALLPPAP